MPRLLDLNNSRDSWLPVNKLTAELGFNGEVSGQVDWKQRCARDPRAYSNVRDNRRPRFKPVSKPLCASIYDVQNANRKTTQRGQRFEQQPRHQCTGGKWWLVLGDNHRTVRHPPAELVPDFPDTPTMNRMVDKVHDTDTAHKMGLYTKTCRDQPIKYHSMVSKCNRFAKGAGTTTALEESPAFHRMSPDAAAFDAVRPHTAPAASLFSETPTGRGLDDFGERAEDAAAARALDPRPQTASEYEREHGGNPGPGHYADSEKVNLGLRCASPAFSFSTSTRGDAFAKAFAARVACGGDAGTAESAQMLPNFQFARADKERATRGMLGTYVEKALAPRLATVGRDMTELNGFDPFSVRAWRDVAERCGHDLGNTPTLASRLPDELNSTYASVFKSQAPRLGKDSRSGTNDGNPEIGPTYCAPRHDNPVSVKVREPDRMTATFSNDRKGKVPIRTDMRLMDGGCDTLVPRISSKAAGQLPDEARYGVPGSRDARSGDPRERVTAQMTFRPKRTKWTRVENGIVKGPRRKYAKPWNERPSKAVGRSHIPNFD